MSKGRMLRSLLFPSLLILGLLIARWDGARYLPPCLLHKWTGLHCPGCGGTRAFRALSHGDLVTAIGMNPFAVALMFAVALITLRISWEAVFPEKRWPRLAISDRWAWLIVVVMLLFAVLRNLPWWPFTLLAPS